MSEVSSGSLVAWSNAAIDPSLHAPPGGYQHVIIIADRLALTCGVYFKTVMRFHVDCAVEECDIVLLEARELST